LLNKHGKSTLMMAHQNGHNEVIKVLHVNKVTDVRQDNSKSTRWYLNPKEWFRNISKPLLAHESRKNNGLSKRIQQYYITTEICKKIE